MLFSVLELPFYILTWFDYYWNSLWKKLSGISNIFLIPSIITMPVTWINGFTLAFLIYLKYKLIGTNLTFERAIAINLDRFPEL